MHRRMSSALLSVGLLALLLSASVARADELYGRIRGTVTDPSGAVVPGARVTVTNMATGVAKNMNTLATGGFEFVNLLAPGTYQLVVEKQGFQKSQTGAIQLNVNQVYVANVTLQIGTTAQTITVEETNAQINTTQIQLGTTVTGKQIVDLPLNGRDWIQLQQLQPGVVGQGDARLRDAYATNGGEAQQNAFYVNGMDTGDISLNVPDITIPSPDAIGEFHLVTNTINPEYGRNSGAIMNAVIKNGTNQLHGDGFEFYRDTSLDARSFFQPTVSTFHQNEFGGTVGGPVLLPHVYNGRDKTFFFFSYQGRRTARPELLSDCNCNPGNTPVFSSAQRAGVFPDLATSAGSSAIALVGDNGTTYPAGTPYSTIFSNGQIPTADLNPLAVKLMNQYVPPPNGPGNTYLFNSSFAQIQDQYIWRMDENISSKDSIWAFGLWERDPDHETEPFGGGYPYGGATLPGFTQTDNSHSQTYSISWNHTFGPTTLNEARFGYLRFNFASVFPQTPINPTTYGFTGVNPQILSDASLPVVDVKGYFELGFSTNGPQPRIQNTYMFTDNFSKLVGRHSFKAGVSISFQQLFNPYLSDLSGVFGFQGGGAFSTGDPGADFLLGQPDSFSQASGSIQNNRAREYYLYVQDQFKLRSNVTITYGLGWDIETPYTNLYAHGEFVNGFRAGVQSHVFPTAPPGILWPGDDGITDTGGVKTPYHDFAPRVGFAWSPGGSQKWSIHAGYGIYFNRTEEELALQNLLTPPFTLTSSGVADIGGSPSFANPYAGWCKGPVPCSEPNKFPFTPPAPGASVNFAGFEPFVINTLSPNFGVPYSENYNVTIERQLSNTTNFSIAYVGNVGRHLEGAYELNPAGSAIGNPGAAALGCSPFNLFSCDPGSFKYNPSTFGAINYQDTSLNSNYNSLQMMVNRQFSHGLQFAAAYTWSRFFDQNSTFDNQAAFIYPGLNPFNLHSMYAPSDNDAPQRFVVNWTYTLPIYHFYHHVAKLTDGWRVAGIATFQHGTPIELYDSADASLTCNASYEYLTVPCWDRPSSTGSPLSIGNPRNHTFSGNSNYWFNPAAFTIPPLGTFGNAARSPLYGPGLNNFDIALFKDIHFTESKYVELRLESYNTFNHAQFQGPSAFLGTSDVNTPSLFGRIVSVVPGSTGGEGRVLQLAGKIYF